MWTPIIGQANKCPPSLWFPRFTLPWAMNRCQHTPRIGYPAPKALVETLGIVEPEVAAQPRTSRGHALTSVKIHLLVPP